MNEKSKVIVMCSIIGLVMIASWVFKLKWDNWLTEIYIVIGAFLFYLIGKIIKIW